MRTICLLTLLALSFCAKDLFDVSKFHEMVKSYNGAKITTEICIEETHLQVIRLAVEPDEIIKGEDIGITVQQEALESLIIKNLHVSAIYNGFEIFYDDKDQDMTELEEGDLFEWEYLTHVPTFVPAGEWNIYLYLETDTDQKVSCVLVHWVIED